MRLHKLLKLVFVLLILLAVTIGLTSISHPIILKWVTGSARHFGRPIAATIYTNGQVNDQVKVFYTDEADNYLLSLTAYDSLETFKFLNIDLNEKSIGIPLGVSKNDYDFIAGHLFQSKTGGHLTPLRDHMEGLDFDPQITFIDGQLKFRMPPNKLKFDSLRIRLH